MFCDNWNTDIMKMTIYSSLGILLLCVVSTAVKHPHYDIYKRFEGEHSGLGSVLKVENISLLMCAAKCSRTLGCYGADYQSAPTMQCDLVGATVTSTSPQPDSTYLCCDCEVHTPPVAQPNLLGLWPLTKRFQGRDISTNGAHGTLNSVTHLTAPCWSQVYATTFAGVKESYVEIPNDGSLEIKTFAFTWTAWVKPSPSFSEGPLFSWHHPIHANNLGTHVWLVNSGIFLKVVDKVSGPKDPLRSTPEYILDLNAWNKVGVSYDGPTGIVSAIINGQVKTETRTDMLNMDVSSHYNVFIGSRYYDGSPILDARSFSGNIACVKLYDASMDLSQLDLDDPACGTLEDWTQG